MKESIAYVRKVSSLTPDHLISAYKIEKKERVKEPIDCVRKLS